MKKLKLIFFLLLLFVGCNSDRIDYTFYNSHKDNMVELHIYGWYDGNIVWSKHYWELSVDSVCIAKERGIREGKEFLNKLKECE